MILHATTYGYLKPTEQQLTDMAATRERFRLLSDFLEINLPDGADKTFVLRTVRTAAMWANVSITREADGGPRE